MAVEKLKISYKTQKENLD